MTQFQQDIDIFSVLEEMFEPDYVVMVQTSMNLNFTHELLLCATLGERCLCNDLCSGESLSL
jgi:hypothetical protein